MDRVLTRLERRFGRLAPSGMIVWLVGFTALAYLVLYARPELYVEFTLEPHSLANGEWWRLLTFLFLPWSVGRGGLNAFFALFALQMLYMVGSSLEAEWGSFRFDAFYLLAALATIASSLIFGSVTNLYINESLFLAFATEFPEYEILLFFILPVKMKWVGIGTGALLVYQMAVGGTAQRVGMLVAMAAFLLFCGGTLVERLRGRAVATSRRRTQGQSAAAFAPVVPRARVCARCGRSSKDEPGLEFRVCDCAEKCHGKLTEYCIDHARAH
jgi:hypothetical protein